MASGASSSADRPLTVEAVADRVGALVVVRQHVLGLRAGGGRGERAGLDAHLVAGEVGGQHAVLVVAEHVGQVLVQRAAVGDVEQLHAAADAEHGDVVLAGGARERQLEGVAAGLLVGGRRVRLLPVAVRRDVAAAAAEDHAVERREQVVRVRGVRRRRRRAGARGRRRAGRHGRRR